jgi:uncharacterized repeat protein (TIGR03803 family)
VDDAHRLVSPSDRTGFELRFFQSAITMGRVKCACRHNFNTVLIARGFEIIVRRAQINNMAGARLGDLDMTPTKNTAGSRSEGHLRGRKQDAAATPPSRANLLLIGASALAVVCGYGGTAQAAPKLKVLYSFTANSGFFPFAGLVADGAGNLYGTTFSGGTTGDGVVFELSPPAGSKKAWTEKVLHPFNGADGENPYSGLIVDSERNLYGTTYIGGAHGDGVVFELSPPAEGETAWTESVLHSFDGKDGQNPYLGSLLADSAGDLFGTTIQGGRYKDGLVFRLSPPVAGEKAWTETVLAKDGLPEAGLIADAAGNLYGTTQSSVFELSPPLAGKKAWTEKVLCSFNGGANGGELAGGVLADGAGNLYGTAQFGGANNYGVVFELSPPTGGQTAWTETVLASFDKTNGEYPIAGLIADSAGVLYGTASGGGQYNGGVAFRVPIR